MSKIPKLGGQRKTAIHLRPTGKRYETLEIEEETDYVLKAKEGDRTRHIFKSGPGFSDGKNTIFFSVEGQPVTAYIKGEVTSRIDVFKYLAQVWGDEIYDKFIGNLPPKYREPLVGVEVEIEAAEIEEDAKPILDKVKAAEFLRESNLIQLDDLGKSTPQTSPVQNAMSMLLYIGLGAFFMYFVVKQGYI